MNITLIQASAMLTAILLVVILHIIHSKKKKNEDA